MTKLESTPPFDALALGRACEPLLGRDDGKWIFESIFAALKNKTVTAAA